MLKKLAVKRTTSSIEELSKMAPEVAKKIVETEIGEKIQPVPVNDISRGDRLVVATGDKIPVDGIVIWGSGSADESLLTGESLPIEKDLDSSLIAGSKLLSGSLKFKATAVADETTLAQIIKMVSDARARKPKIQRLADRVAAIFTPVVFSLALITFLISISLGIEFKDALIRAIAVLVISCPCAMGLATPTAIMVGIGRAAKEGILIKSGSALEVLSKIKTVAFDKTGTLTTGRFKIENLKIMNGEEAEIKGILVELEKHSLHPIASSITREFNTNSNYQLNSVHEEKGLGVSGIDANGNKYMAGSWRIAKELTEDLSHDLYLVKNKELLAWIDLSDEVKDASKKVIEQLKDNNIFTVMLSGDRKEKCLSTAQQVGIDEYSCGLLPDKKLEILENLQSKGITAFVGDGINDAPSLAHANVGISLAEASQAAIDSAEVVLMNQDIKQLIRALQLSQLTVITIKQNLFWAFFYNSAAIPLAAAGYLNPIIAALAMAFSDLMVIGNSLRLRKKQLRD